MTYRKGKRVYFTNICHFEPNKAFKGFLHPFKAVYLPKLKSYKLFKSIFSIIMETTNAPQIIEHLNRSLNYTPYDVKWIPDSSKFMLCGERPRATGLI